MTAQNPHAVEDYWHLFVSFHLVLKGKAKCKISIKQHF